MFSSPPESLPTWVVYVAQRRLDDLGMQALQFPPQTFSSLLEEATHPLFCCGPPLDEANKGHRVFPSPSVPGLGSKVGSPTPASSIAGSII